jgi:hypothetical protein
MPAPNAKNPGSGVVDGRCAGAAARHAVSGEPVETKKQTYNPKPQQQQQKNQPQPQKTLCESVCPGIAFQMGMSVDYFFFVAKSKEKNK